jgi:hypothetical protein
VVCVGRDTSRGKSRERNDLRVRRLEVPDLVVGLGGEYIFFSYFTGVGSTVAGFSSGTGAGLAVASFSGAGVGLAVASFSVTEGFAGWGCAFGFSAMATALSLCSWIDLSKINSMAAARWGFSPEKEFPMVSRSEDPPAEVLSFE